MGSEKNYPHSKKPSRIPHPYGNFESIPINCCGAISYTPPGKYSNPMNDSRTAEEILEIKLKKNIENLTEKIDEVKETLSSTKINKNKKIELENILSDMTKQLLKEQELWDRNFGDKDIQSAYKEIDEFLGKSIK